MGQKHQTFWGLRTLFPPRDIHKNLHSKCARVPQAMAQFVPKIEKLSYIIVELARACGLHPRLWLLLSLKLNFGLKPEVGGTKKNWK